MRFIGASLMLLALCAPQSAKAYDFEDFVGHIGQPSNWTCGVTAAAMWLNSLYNCSCFTPQEVVEDINANGGSVNRNDGTNINEMMGAMNRLGPWRHRYSEWEYVDKQATVKGLAWTIAAYRQPVAVSGRWGQHWFLVRGVRAEQNPYHVYGRNNDITALYINDSKYDSPVYNDYYFSPNSAYAPRTFMSEVQKIGAWGDKKYRTVERSNSAGSTYENNDSFWSY